MRCIPAVLLPVAPMSPDAFVFVDESEEASPEDALDVDVTEGDIFGASGFGEPIATLGLLEEAQDQRDQSAERAPSSCRWVVSQNVDGTFSVVEVFGATEWLEPAAPGSSASLAAPLDGSRFSRNLACLIAG